MEGEECEGAPDDENPQRFCHQDVPQDATGGAHAAVVRVTVVHVPQAEEHGDARVDERDDAHPATSGIGKTRLAKAVRF